MGIDNQDLMIGGLAAWQAMAIMGILLLFCIGRDSDDL
tara:strand:- start:490 stop:603 length:114 start_codon:yes stop_codon:yes gene_type:complete